MRNLQLIEPVAGFFLEMMARIDDQVPEYLLCNNIPHILAYTSHLYSLSSISDTEVNLRNFFLFEDTLTQSISVPVL